MDREITVILHADVVGYSRLMGENEERTYQQLSSALGLLIEQIENHGGKKINEAGDAILAEFSSVTASVKCALLFQQQMAELDEESHVEETVQFRIGLNLGEVIRDKNEIYGDGVNIAARIEAMAPPGGVCASSAVLEQISSTFKFDYIDLGFRNFKNISRPIHVYELKQQDLYANHPMANLESGVKGQPIFDEAFEKKVVTRGRCACGSINIEITHEPLGTGFCHCRICRLSTGAPLFAWAAFPIESVKFTKEQPKIHRLSLIAEKGFCEKCGCQVMWRGLKPEAANYYAMPTAILDNPEDYAPVWHGGCESQLPWLQIHDELPRAKCEDSPFLRAAWSSMDAGDPDDWISLDYDKSQSLEE